MLGVDDFKLCEVRRLGMISSREPRPIRVVCENPYQRSILLRRGKDLKTREEYHKTYINLDLTSSQYDKMKH